MANLYKVFKDFILDNKKSSFIYFLTFNLNNQKNLIDLSKLTLRYLINDRDDIKYAILDSSEFDKNYENLKKEYLEKGKRVFIITNYNTIGAGINLQYKITSDNLKHNLHLKIDNERDYDGIFLSKPTNIIPSIEKSYFDYDKLNKLLDIRFKNVEDRIVVSESGNTKKLKKELTDRKIPASHRDEILLVCDNNRVLWACGVRRCEDCRVTGSTKNVFKIQLILKERN